MSSSSSSPCAACKFLRRKCTQGCVFAPYFPPDNPAKFSQVHRVFGASNVAKLLNDIAPAQRDDAVNSLAYEADARLRDPVYGCSGHITALHHRLLHLQRELFAAQKELSSIIGNASVGAFPPNHLFHAGVGIGLGLGSQQMTFRDQNQYGQQEQQQMVNVQQLAEAVAAAREQEMRDLEKLIVDGGGVVAEASSSLTMVVAPPQHNLHHNFHHQHISGSHEGRSGVGPSS